MKGTAAPRIEGLCGQSVPLFQFVDEIPIGILVVDPAHRVLFMNRAMEALTGALKQEAAGIPCWYILRSNVCVKGCPVRKASEESGSACCEADIVNRSRERIPVRFTAAPIFSREEAWWDS